MSRNIEELIKAFHGEMEDISKALLAWMASQELEPAVAIPALAKVLGMTAAIHANDQDSGNEALLKLHLEILCAMVKATAKRTWDMKDKPELRGVLKGD